MTSLKLAKWISPSEIKRRLNNGSKFERFLVALTQ